MLKRKIFYALTLFCVLIVNILYVDYEPFVLLLVLILFPVVMWILLKVQYYVFDIDISMQNKVVVKGDSVYINIDAENGFILPISKAEVTIRAKYANYDDESVHTVSFSVPQVGKIRIKTSIVPKYCGCIYIYVENVKLYDYVSMNTITKPSKANCSITIMPELHRPSIDNIHAARALVLDSDEYSQTVPGDDPSEIFDLREYTEGDSLNRIHWKLSSKSENLIIKEFSQPLKKKEVILVELLSDDSEKAKNNMDCLYETVFALGTYLLSCESDFNIVWYDKQLNSLRAVNIQDFMILENEIKNIIQMYAYDKAYAAEYFWKSELSQNAKVHYIKCEDKKENEDDKDIRAAESKNINFADSNIFLIGDKSIQDIVDSFYLTV